MVTLEALVPGVPVVAAATGGTLELMAHGPTALFYPRRNVAVCAAP